MGLVNYLSDYSGDALARHTYSFAGVISIVLLYINTRLQGRFREAGIVYTVG